MTISLSAAQLRLLRMRGQQLYNSWNESSVVQIAKKVCGIQAQDAPAATLAIRPRSTGVTAADVKRAIEEERSILRTWAMRGTLHLVATEDLSWMLSLFGPVFSKGTRRRRLELGLDDQTSGKAVQLIDQILADSGPLTRAELAKQLDAHHIPTAGQAIAHAIGYAALQGVLCFGPDRNGKPTYVRLDDWIKRPPAPPQDEALIELARRYLKAYGPATTADLASWSGLPMAQVKAAWSSMAGELLEVDVNGNPAWMLQSQVTWLEERPPQTPIVRLLPAYDIYLLGYQSRDLILDLKYARRVHPGGGVIRPSLLVHGRILGKWKLNKRRTHTELLVEPFETLTPSVYSGLEAEVADLSRFLQTETTLHV